MDRLETRRNLDQISVAYPEYSLQHTPLLDKEDQKAFDDFLRQFDLDTHELTATQSASNHTTTATSTWPILPLIAAPNSMSQLEVEAKNQTNNAGSKQVADSIFSNTVPTSAQTNAYRDQLNDNGTLSSTSSSPMTSAIETHQNKRTLSDSPQKCTAKRKFSDTTNIEPITKGNNTRLPGRGKKAPHELLSEKEKKANHIASEQKRRQNIRLGFEQLVEIVPTLSQCHRSESAILQKSVEYIHQLIAQRQQLKQRIRELRISAGDSSDMIDDFSSSDEDIY